MRALLCAFLWLTAVEHLNADEPFYPTPIPLDDWHPAVARSAPDDPLPAPAAPYWEDALRHSVYLTMVRDKIDQLIAQDASHQTNEAVDDHDLWDRIKNAPFDRTETEQPNEVGDLTTMAKGRLMEENGHYRFTEDDTVKPCADESCMEGATALWAVRRVRQRDAEPSTRYHYELTFSVITGPSKRQRKPHENPARTFTVRESAPETIVDAPHEYRPPKDTSYQRIRPGRALWVHKNIVPSHKHQPRHYRPHDTDRLFTSLFMDDDYEAHRRPAAPHPPPPAYTQYSKVGYAGSPSSQYHYKKYSPYSYKQHQTPIKYSKPPVSYPQIPPQHHYLDIDAIGVVSAPYVPQPDTRYYVPNKVVKTTRPPVLPTPVNTPLPSKNSTVAPTEFSIEVNATYTTNQEVEPIAVHSKPRPTPIKISYFNDHLRHPVYNAPPGVFVTMDKKPFKPLPPLKLHSSLKTMRPSKPLDFRPSPQLLDVQFSEPDPLFDGAFRPISVNYAQRNSTEVSESKVAESSKTEEQIVETDNITDSIIPKKTKKKSQRVTTTTTTTAAPTAIVRLTPQSTESDYDISWGNLLGAFAKTTPMNPHPQNFKLFDNNTIVVTTTTTTTTEPTTTTTTEMFKEEPSTTTVASTTVKRTRPPPQFQNAKTNKIRKHKRVTSTTTKSPLQVTPLKQKVIKVSNDLTPQASSAATSGTRTTGRWTPSSTTTTTTTPKPYSSSSNPSSSTTMSINALISNYQPTKAISTLEPQIVTESSKKQNRYRQSTLMYKGTSVKHDKWSVINIATAKPTVPSPPRRIESNFHGYTKSSTPSPLEEDDYDDYDLTTTTEHQNIKLLSDPSTSETVDDNKSDYTQEIDEPVVNTVSEALHYKRRNEENDSEDYNENENNDQETNSETIYSFYSKSTTPMTSKSNEVDGEIKTTEITDNSTVKPKKKCKKKTLNSTSTTLSFEQSTSSVSPTEISTPSDMFEDFFSSFTSEDEDKNLTTKDIDTMTAGSDNEFTKADEFLNFLNLPNYTVLDKDNNDEISEDDEYNDDLDEDDEFDDHDSGIEETTKDRSYDEDIRESRNMEARDTESTEHHHPYSIFELMAMD